jgi:hypothetical protein
MSQYGRVDIYTEFPYDPRCRMLGNLAKHRVEFTYATNVFLDPNRLMWMCHEKQITKCADRSSV